MAETRWYRQRGAIDIACVECNNFFTPQREFVILHYSCFLPHIELIRKLEALAGTNAEIRKVLEDFKLELDKLKEAEHATGR